MTQLLVESEGGRERERERKGGGVGRSLEGTVGSACRVQSSLRVGSRASSGVGSGL